MIAVQVEMERGAPVITMLGPGTRMGEFRSFINWIREQQGWPPETNWGATAFRFAGTEVPA